MGVFFPEKRGHLKVSDEFNSITGDSKIETAVAHVILSLVDSIWYGNA